LKNKNPFIKYLDNIHPTGVTAMNTSIFKLIAISSITVLASVSHAAWDISISDNDSQLLAASNSFATDGELRFASQMTSTNEPDANGFLYVENIAQYNCQKSAYQLVRSIGFKSWDDKGVSIDQALGKWNVPKAGTPEQVMLNKLCNQSMADASSFINK
jgi:hypothetical protein